MEDGDRCRRPSGLHPHLNPGKMSSLASFPISLLTDRNPSLYRTLPPTTVGSSPNHRSSTGREEHRLYRWRTAQCVRERQNFCLFSQLNLSLLHTPLTLLSVSCTCIVHFLQCIYPAVDIIQCTGSFRKSLDSGNGARPKVVLAHVGETMLFQPPGLARIGCLNALSEDSANPTNSLCASSLMGLT